MAADEIQLERTLTLRGAVTLNLLDMIGVGPFLTLPLLIGAMGGPQAMLGWVLGAGLAVCDGMVWAELGAAMPEAGGTYAYLGEMYPGRLGRWLSFLFAFQLLLSAPLSVASGCIGLAQYAGAVWAPLRAWHVWVAVGVVVVAVVLLYRKLSGVRRIAQGLLVVVLATIAWAVVTGVWHGHWAQVVTVPTGAFRLDHNFFAGLGAAMLLATYDYWGYYNVTFLGGEAKDPGRTIPRAVLWSIGIVAVLYLALNASVLSVVSAPAMLRGGAGMREELLSRFMEMAYAPSVGAHRAAVLGKVAAVLVMVTAFGSVFSLLLGYSRIPYAAARDGNFPRVFGRLHRTRRFPFVSLLVLGGVACVCCFFSLAEVIAALVVLRIVMQFSLQHVGVMLLRKRRPEMKRPFRMWLYPLPPIMALIGFGYIVFVRRGSARELMLAAVVVAVGTAVFAVRGRRSYRANHAR
ncbi:MAG TPA: APC family permease [Acidobacteriaceae bacterium]|jgi:amino acid transporter|nr:APC family permease [Acidobacteriaceae bacterium]